MTIAAESTAAFTRRLREAGIHRFHLVWDHEAEAVRPSHPELAGLAAHLEADRVDFDQHEGIFGQLGPETGALQIAVVHRTVRGQGAGGTRYWAYDDVGAFLRDGMRLARGMTRKNALAGLWWGGGKGVICREDDQPWQDRAFRDAVYADYGRLCTAIRGVYVTAEDVGTSVEDMAAVFTTTRFTTCIPPEIGGSGNPSVPTARGVVKGMEAALAHKGIGSLSGKRVAVQGLGHVGGPLVGMLVERGATVIGSDIDPGRVEALAAAHPGCTFRTSARGDRSILFEEVDVVAPCATGAVLDPETIPRIRAGIVCGAANNQLADPERDDALLQEHGVLYVPDFLVNRMGIVTCADEQYGYVTHDPAIERHLGEAWEGGIYQRVLQVLANAARTGEPPDGAARREADRLSLEPHPIWGHRGRRIVDTLVAERWFDR